MVDTIKLSFIIKDYNEYKRLKKSFDKNIHLDNEGRLKSEKYYLNKSFGYGLYPASDIVPFDIMTVDGSMAKQLKGNNWINHKYNPIKDEKRFYEIINEDTKGNFTPKDLCFISRFDVGLNLENIDPIGLISQFYALSPARMSKHIWDGSFRIGNKTRQLRIYDKAKEILENTKDTKIKNTISGKTLSRIETQLVRNRNIYKKHNIKSVSDILTFKTQKDIFFDTYKKIVKIDKVKEMSKKRNHLTLSQFGELQELKTVLRDFGDLEHYRKFLIEKGYDKGGVSRKISRLRIIIQFLERETFISLSDRIDKEMKRLKESWSCRFDNNGICYTMPFSLS